jgi:hypothetical protein
MHVERWGARRDSGATTLFDKTATAVVWSASTDEVQMTVRGIRHGTQGQYNYSIGLSLKDIRDVLEALGKECSLPAISVGLQPAMLDLFRLQAAAAGLATTKR